MQQAEQSLEVFNAPKQAYLHFPKGDEIFTGKEKKIVRWYFDGDTTYSDFENQRYDKLQQYLKEKQKENLIAGWNKQRICRELQGCHYDNKKTVKSLEDQNDWITSVSKEVDPDIQDFFNLDFMQVLGRDNRYRPIIVMKMYKIDPKAFPIEKLLKGVDYVNKLVIDKMMIPGQVENWVVIQDLGNQGISSIPLSMIKNIISYMSSHYKSRLYRLYMVNTTSAITGIWKAIKFFLEDCTVKKINILKESVPEKMYEHVNKSQVSETYGGLVKEEISKQWPPQLNNNGPFNAEGETAHNGFITVEEYKQKCNNGEIKEGKICLDIVNN